MDVIFGFLVIGVGITAVFAFGIIVGIADCKRRFLIPKKAVGVDGNGYIYN